MPEQDIEYAPDKAGRQQPGAATGIWSLGHEGPVLVDAAWTGTPLVLVPTEDILILAVDLPIANRTQRLAALPFAVEDQVSEPIETLHVALGAELAPGRYLAGVVRHDRMAHWCAMIDAGGLEQAAILPDALSLPAPRTGCWAVAADGDRMLVRRPDGIAFALPLSAFDDVWDAADRPPLISCGETLPDRFSAEPAGPGWAGPSTVAGSVPLDLRQGRYARASNGPPWLRRVLQVAVIGLLAHAAIYAVDTVALVRSADARQAETAALVAAAGGPTGGDLAATAESMLPHGDSGDGLLPVFGRAARALQPVGTTVSFQSLGYERASGLTMELEASDLASLQRAEAVLREAGLQPVGGDSVVENGRASQTITLSPGNAVP
jgi:general secretion pathway protein L